MESDWGDVAEGPFILETAIDRFDQYGLLWVTFPLAFPALYYEAWQDHCGWNLTAPNTTSRPRERVARIEPKMMRKVPRNRDLREIPQSKAQPLAAYSRAHPERDRAITEVYASGGYAMQEIGDYFGW